MPDLVSSTRRARRLRADGGRIRYNNTICTVSGCWGRILAKRTNFGIPNKINAVRFRSAAVPGSLAPCFRREVKGRRATCDCPPPQGEGSPRAAPLASGQQHHLDAPPPAPTLAPLPNPP